MKVEVEKDHRHGRRRKRLQVAITRVAQVRPLVPNGDFGRMLTTGPAVGEGIASQSVQYYESRRHWTPGSSSKLGDPHA